MPLAIGCLALAFPRVALFVVWLLAGDYLLRPFDHFIWPVLGFLFLPLTTLAFVYGMNSLGAVGEMPPLGWVLVVVAALMDLGMLGKGSQKARRRRRHEDEDEE